MMGMEEKITYKDLEQYHHLFTLVPAFLLKRMAVRNSNLIQKFKSAIESHLNSLNDDQKNKLDIILNSEVEELQVLLAEAYIKTGLKQYEILSNPKYREFIELNLDELKKIV